MPGTRSKFTGYCNRFKTIKIIARKQCHSEKFKSFGNNLKATWNLIKSMLGKSWSEDAEHKFVKDGMEINSPLDIANTFNSYFFEHWN